MDTAPCPICNKSVNIKEIEHHVNNCLFLNSGNDDLCSKKRKDATVSPRPTKMTRTVSSDHRKNQETQNKGEDPPSASSPLALIHKSRQDTTVSRNSDELYEFQVPLAEVLRPSAFNDFVGQEQVVGNGTVLRKLLDHADIPSLILWGPPGCGKTTLANVVKDILVQRGKENGKPVRFVKLYATMAGVGDVKEVINAAKNESRMFQKRTILFMDEIHRFNKAQQDTFLPHIENGTITLIGATTENPSFSLNNALLSRCRVIVMEKLSIENVTKILRRAVDYIGGYITATKEDTKTEEKIMSFSSFSRKWCVDSATIQWLAEISDGDARIALNSLQMAIQSKKDTDFCITLNDIKDGIKKSHILYDKKGEEHYNLISAFHKSIRASDDNAALYWLTRMLQSGEDPMYVARRLVRIAGEDIGLAEPNALVLAVSTLQGCQFIGMPECDVLLAELTVFLARCSKSTEVYNALNNTKTFISEHKGALPSVPLHLRNAPTRLMKNLGYQKNYNKEHKDVSGLEYMPEGFEHVTFFSQGS